MDPLLDFSDQVAIITGASSGFGRLVAIGLAERGCNLVLGDLNQQGLDETHAMLNLDGNKAVTMIADVSNEAQCKAMADAALEHFGKITLGINNAGIAHELGPVHQMTESIMQKQMAVNVNGVLFGMKYQIEAMLKSGGGHIINVSSMAGLGGAPKGGAYSAAKHAVIGLTRTAAVEYARKNIRVNAICPFYSPTNIMAVDGFDSEENQARLAQGCPMKRLAKPQEVVNTMLLIMSPGNSYMNGQTIAIDGGVSAW